MPDLPAPPSPGFSAKLFSVLTSLAAYTFGLLRPILSVSGKAALDYLRGLKEKDFSGDLKSIAKGALIAAGGAAIAAISGQGVIGYAVASVLLNAARKFILPRFLAFTLLLALSLSIASSAYAAPPTPTILGPTGGRPGDLIVLDASKTGATSHEWKVYPLALPDGRPAILPDGAKCHVASVEGKRTIFWAGANNDGLATLVWEVSITSNPTPGPNPSPGPPAPAPGPTPAPVPPGPSSYGMSRKVFDLVVKLEALPRSRAPAVASAFDGLSSKIAAGALGVAAVSSETRRAFDAATGDQKPAWAPIDAAIQAELRSLATAGKVGSIAQLGEAYAEIAAGCNAAK